MSNLLNDSEGRSLIIEAQRHLLRRRLSRFFKRNLVIDYEQWSTGAGEFDLATLLGSLNVAEDDELRDLYRLLGSIGGLTESLSSVQVWVDPATGSDITGTGSSSNPYASLWFLSLLPRRIAHPYYILIQGDVDLDRLDLDFTFAGEHGSVNIIGVGEYTEVSPGGTTTAVATLNTTWQEWDLNTAPSAAIRQSFLHIDDGTLPAKNHYASPVNRIDVANSRIWTRAHPWFGIAPGLDYHYIRPTNTLTVRSVNINCSGAQDCKTNTDCEGSRVNFVNLIIKLDNDGDIVRDQMILDGCPIGMFFVQIQTTSGAAIGNYIVQIKTAINKYNPVVDTSIIDGFLGGLTVNNLWYGGSFNPVCCGVQFANYNSTVYAYTDSIVRYCGGSEAWFVDAMGGCLVNGNVSLYSCSAKHWAIERATLSAEAICGTPETAASDCFSINGSVVDLTTGLCGNGQTGVSARNSKVAIGASFGGDTAATITVLTQYAMSFYGLSTGYLEPTAWSGTSGTSQDTNFPDVPASSFPFPASAARVTDGIGNSIARG